MTGVMTQDGAPRRDRVRKLRDGVSGYALAAHLGVSRQYVERLTAEGVLTRRPDGLFDQTASRLAYLKHLKAERHGSTSTAAQAEYARQKTRPLPGAAAPAGKLRLISSQIW
jgi:hypothetical protein